MKEAKGNGIIKLIAIGAIAALAYAQFGVKIYSSYFFSYILQAL